MINSFKKHLDKHFSFVFESKILIGLSGGLDSIVLSHLLKNLNIEIALAHVNFNLRGEESNKDEFFVIQWAQENKLALFKTSFQTEKESKKRKISIEMAARDLRYDWFKSLIKDYSYNYIAVAHHLNDNIETVLMNLSRGTGIDGITGMNNISGKVIRPLLPFTRKEIEQYANDNDLEWREDLSNRDTIYKRNKIRHELIPIFEELNPSFLESFAKNINNFKQSSDIQKEYIENVNYDFWNEKDDIIEISIPKLKELTAFETILREKLLTYNFKNIDDIIKGLESISGKEFFSQTHRIIKDRNHLLLSKLKEKKTSSFFITEDDTIVNTPINIYLSENKHLNKTRNLNIAQFDKSKLTFPLELRKWENADFFFPIGMNGKKKISKFYKDEKFSTIDKENQWLLTSGSAIIWVIGKRMDERFKVTESTSAVIQFEFFP
ncbi:MAG: tRNA lysidine(34) synthetase TilS [Flavobacteriales bacterium]|nr:tRNA lysidine(34) synthetase TilS [Flavobacteriales bacterium]